MTSDSSFTKTPKSQKAAAGLLAFLIVLCFCIVTLGGFVRLSGSGMAIPEWPFHTTKFVRDDAGTVIDKELTVFPPSTEEGWETLRATFVRDVPGFQQGIALDEFKTMFFIEWSHRATGFFISMTFLGTAIFVFTNANLRRRIGKYALIACFVLPAQIVMGGILVKLHLEAEALATHLCGAFIFTSLLFYSLMKLIHAPAPKAQLGRARVVWMTAAAVYALVLVQVFSGGLMAGNDAGYTMNTWPKMGDSIVPPNLFDRSMNPILNFTENVMMVQFFHRWFAFVVLTAVVYLVLSNLTVEVSKAGRWMLRGVAFIVTLQLLLGILTLVGLNEKVGPVQPHIALTHQSLGLVVLLTVLGIVYETKNQPVRAEAALAAEDEARAAARQSEAHA